MIREKQLSYYTEAVSWRTTVGRAAWMENIRGIFFIKYLLTCLFALSTLWLLRYTSKSKMHKEAASFKFDRSPFIHASRAASGPGREGSSSIYF